MANFQEMPRVRLTIEHMRHEIIHAFRRHNSEIEERVAVAVQRAVENFDFDGEVRRIADEAIRKVVGDAVRNLIGWELQEQITEQVRQELQARINRTSS